MLRFINTSPGKFRNWNYSTCVLIKSTLLFFEFFFVHNPSHSKLIVEHRVKAIPSNTIAVSVASVFLIVINC